jgi:general stress protein YciG
MTYRVLVQGVPIECDTVEEAMTLAGWKGRGKEEGKPEEKPESIATERALKDRESGPPTAGVQKKITHPLQPNGKQRRGFACMDRALVSQIARKGGKRAHEIGLAHEFTQDEAREAGRKGGRTTAQNRQHMSAIGRLSGVARGKRLFPRTPASASGGGDGLVRNGGSPAPDQDRAPERGSEEGGGG